LLCLLNNKNVENSRSKAITVLHLCIIKKKKEKRKKEKSQTLLLLIRSVLLKYRLARTELDETGNFTSLLTSLSATVHLDKGLR
jgi:hypothetical protein